MIKFDPTTQEVLNTLEKTRKEFWNISRITGEFLYTLIKSANCKNVLEIGTSNGYSGIWIAKALKDTGGKLTTIEFYEKRHKVASENFKKCGVADIITIKEGSAVKILKSMPEDYKIDFAFVDANKQEYIEYFKHIDKHLTKGGYLCCDNVLSHKEKVKPFIESICADKNYENAVLDLPAGLSVARKTA